MADLDRERLRSLTERELRRLAAARPRSQALPSGPGRRSSAACRCRG